MPDYVAADEDLGELGDFVVGISADRSSVIRCAPMPRRADIRPPTRLTPRIEDVVTRVSEWGLKEFIAIYEKEFGELISEDGAREMANRVLTLYKLVMRPLPWEVKSMLGGEQLVPYRVKIEQCIPHLGLGDPVVLQPCRAPGGDSDLRCAPRPRSRSTTAASISAAGRRRTTPGGTSPFNSPAAT